SRSRLFDVSEAKVLYAVLARHNSFHGISRIFRDLLAVVGRSPVSDEHPDDERNEESAGDTFKDALPPFGSAFWFNFVVHSSLFRDLLLPSWHIHALDQEPERLPAKTGECNQGPEGCRCRVVGHDILAADNEREHPGYDRQ